VLPCAPFWERKEAAGDNFVWPSETRTAWEFLYHKLEEQVTQLEKVSERDLGSGPELGLRPEQGMKLEQVSGKSSGWFPCSSARQT
jgi:hypothetical protein